MMTSKARTNLLLKKYNHGVLGQYLLLHHHVAFVK